MTVEVHIAPPGPRHIPRAGPSASAPLGVLPGLWRRLGRPPRRRSGNGAVLARLRRRRCPGARGRVRRRARRRADTPNATPPTITVPGTLRVRMATTGTVVSLQVVDADLVGTRSPLSTRLDGARTAPQQADLLDLTSHWRPCGVGFQSSAVRAHPETVAVRFDPAGAVRNRLGLETSGGSTWTGRTGEVRQQLHARLRQLPKVPPSGQRRVGSRRAPVRESTSSSTARPPSQTPSPGTSRASSGCVWRWLRPSRRSCRWTSTSISASTSAELCQRRSTASSPRSSKASREP